MSTRNVVAADYGRLRISETLVGSVTGTARPQSCVDAAPIWTVNAGPQFISAESMAVYCPGLLGSCDRSDLA